MIIWILKELVHTFKTHQDLLIRMSGVMVKAWISMFLVNSLDHVYAEESLENAALEAILEQWISNFNRQTHWCAFKG